MTYGIKLRVWGDYACFTRPEMKVERYSYDMITPGAACGILEAIYWKPAISWAVDRITVLKPIRFQSIRRNEISHKVSASLVSRAMKAGSAEGLHRIIEVDRQQRAATILRDVDYLIEAYFEVVKRAGQEESGAKHREMFMRRAARGQCYHRPFLGCREFPANFAIAEEDIPESTLPADQLNRDLGWMLYDIDFETGMRPRFFAAQLRDGVLVVPPKT